MTHQEPLKILCIEDNPVNWRLVQRLLTQGGYEVYWAEEGLQGYELAVAHKPALVLLDINLPGLSGFEVAAKLRQNPDLNHIPIVALTAKTMKSDRETALVAGCDGFISKPIDPFQFVGQVQAYLGGQRDRIEQSREGAALRQFSHQVVDHLEAQLLEVQDSNRKLTEAQDQLQKRNRQLSRLLTFSQRILDERDPDALIGRVLSQVTEEIRIQKIHVYQVHPSGGFLEGIRWVQAGIAEAPSIPIDRALVRRLGPISSQGALYAEKLVHSPFWDEGVALGLWGTEGGACLIPQPHRQNEGELWGFWSLSRNEGGAFQGAEVELAALYAGLFQVTQQNTDLIVDLNESGRALAGSYERLESAYADLQNAQQALGLRERQALLGDLFQKMAQRLQQPVASLHRQTLALDRHLAQEPSHAPGAGAGTLPKGNGAEESTLALGEIRDAVAKIDGLVKALMRRVGKQGSDTPEWIDLHDLVQQELDLIESEGTFAQGLQVRLELRATLPLIFGVYGDFADAFSHLIQHAVTAPIQGPSLAIRTRSEEDCFLLEVEDQGGAIPPASLAKAFEPFNELSGPTPVLGVRMPGAGLPGCTQLLAAYRGTASLRNTDYGTLVELRIPLR